MHKNSVTKPEIKLVGICVRTSYEQELDKMKGNIFPYVRRYFHEMLSEKIPNRANQVQPSALIPTMNLITEALILILLVKRLLH